MFRNKGFLVLLIVFGILLSACGGSGSQSPAAQENAAAAESASTAEPVSTADPVYVYMDCGSDFVPTGSDIALYYNWVTQSEQQVGDFALAVQHAVSVDGKPVTIKLEGNDRAGDDR